MERGGTLPKVNKSADRGRGGVVKAKEQKVSRLMSVWSYCRD